MTRGQYLDRGQRQASEAVIVRLQRVDRALRNMQVAPLQHGQQLGADHVEQFHLHVRIVLRVSMQKRRYGTFQVLRRGGNLEHAGVTPPQELGLFSYRVGIVQQPPAMPEQLLALTGQAKAPPHAVEQLQTEFCLEIADVP